MKTILYACLLLAGSVAYAAKPEVIPELKQWTDASSADTFKLRQDSAISISAGNKALLRYAATFAKDLGISYSTAEAKAGDIVMVVDPKLDSKLGDEGYTLTVTPDQITIRAKTAKGAYWGTRSILQVFNAQARQFPCGTAEDWPSYPVRGFMFDCGRKPFTMTTLNQIVEIMSYYKLNDLQLHLSDNYIWLHNYPGVKTAADVLKVEPSAGAFRLESSIPGLTSTDISYSKQTYDSLVRRADAQGVKIIPELDVPGHALAMVRVRPELMYKGPVYGHKDIERAAMLDLSNPEAFPFISSIFDEYLNDNTFSGDVVHIGTDEYYGDAESYRAFSDKMLKHVLAKGKTPRLWGSLSNKRGKTPVISKGVQMNIWALGWQNPRDAIKEGFDIINILDTYTYVVPNGQGNVGAYCDDINTEVLYKEWNPSAFRNLSVDPNDKKLLGGAWAVWNDHSFIGDPGLCGRDLLPRIKKNCAIVAQKTWDIQPKRSYQDFLKALDTVGSPVDVTLPQWEASYDVERANTPKILADGDETTLYAISPVNGKVGFRREGAQYTFDYTLPETGKVKLTFKTANRKTELYVNDKLVSDKPIRQFWPDSCKFFTLPKPTK